MCSHADCTSLSEPENGGYAGRRAVQNATTVVCLRTRREVLSFSRKAQLNSQLTLRSSHDDRATLRDVRDRGTGQEERSVDVGLDRPVELLGREVGDVLDGVHDRSVVDEDVDSSKGLDDLLDDAVAALLVPDVLRDEKTLSARGGDERLGLVGVDLLLGEVDNRDLPSGAVGRPIESKGVFVSG